MTSAAKLQVATESKTVPRNMEPLTAAQIAEYRAVFTYTDSDSAGVIKTEAFADVSKPNPCNCAKLSCLL